MGNKLSNSEKFRFVMKIKKYTFYITAVFSFILMLTSRISEFYNAYFLISRILLGIFFIIFGVAYLYSGVFLRKVTLVGRFGASDTYFGKAAIIQGILAFVVSIILSFIFILGNTKIAIYLIPILIIMMIFHFIFPPKNSSPNIKFFVKK